MFDDQMPQGGAIPNNLPVGEPEDMFAGTDPVSATSPFDAPEESTPVAPIQETRRAVDIPAPPVSDAGLLPTAMDAGKLQPKQETDMPVASPTVDIPLVPPSSIETPGSVAKPQMTPDPMMSTMPSEFTGGHAPMMQEDMRGPNIGRTIMLVGIILIAAAIIGGGIWYTVRLFLTDTTSPENESTVPAVVEIPVTEPEIEETLVPPSSLENSSTTLSADEAPVGVPLPTDISDADVEAAAGDVTENQILFGDDVDTDEDTLSDEREIEFGTDPRNWDTDGDGLSDGVEVLNWGTDPLNPDTDGDGYLDGAEVEAGYSPVAGGGARLFETPSSTATSSTAS